MEHYFCVVVSTPLLRWNPLGITIAGTVGIPGATANQLNTPVGLFVDPFNTLYVADWLNHRVQAWRMGASNGSTVAGRANGTGGMSLSELQNPGDVALDSNNNIYVTDVSNQRVQFWTNGASSGIAVAGITGKKS
ncbi:unnamed protein product [Rotaria sp. Silwood1]|nr:unnamed protein product [Rotaria sp. Silwood1]CAF1568639.1 unnamed protein product [Rotaria sp. Silwood1]CAF3705308.1 unnamed protein product [Rotaria sp. Silwood1]